MSTILLSNTYNNPNQSLLGDIKHILRNSDSVVFIPTAFDRYRDGYNSYVEPFLTEMNFRKVKYKMLEDSQVIFLGGGNTFHFLYWLRKRNLINKLKELTKSKIIIGVSAGALVLTPNIGLSSDKNLILDRNDTFDSVGITRFYIKPHFVDSIQNPHLIREFRNGLAKDKLYPIYGIPDDGGIILEDGKIETYGKIRVHYGEYIKKHHPKSFEL